MAPRLAGPTLRPRPGTVQPVLDAARALAWYPTANLPGGPLYRERKEAHGRLVEALSGLPFTLRLRDRTPLEYAITAAWRLGEATFSNRCGEPYAERREAMAQMRGALDVLDREGPL